MATCTSGLITRRRALGGAAAIAAPMLRPGAAGAASAWTHEAFTEAMRRSGRPIEQTEAQFAAIQARKPGAIRRIEGYLKERLGSADPAVIRAFEEVPRDYYHYNYADRRAAPGDAYEDTPKPWPIGFGSALSDYLGQAYMTQVCRPAPGEITLEVGTGSGFQSSILSRIVKRSYSIEIIEPLGRAVGRIFAPLGYDNIESRVGDGYFGWPEVAGGFDIIIVTCVAQYVPAALFNQLKPGGRLIIPIGQPFKRGQFLYIYTKDADGRVRSKKDVGVFFIPMTGAMMNRPRPAGETGPAAPPANAPPANAPPANAVPADAPPAPAQEPARP